MDGPATLSPQHSVNRPALFKRVLVFAVAALITANLAGCQSLNEIAQNREALARAAEFDDALEKACALEKVVPAEDLILAEWDRLVVVTEGTAGKAVNELLGVEWADDDEYFWGRQTGFVFDGDKPVVLFDYDPRSTPPPAELPLVGPALDSESLYVVPRELAGPEFAESAYDCILISTDHPNYEWKP